MLPYIIWQYRVFGLGPYAKGNKKDLFDCGLNQSIVLFTYLPNSLWFHVVYHTPHMWYIQTRVRCMERFQHGGRARWAYILMPEKRKWRYGIFMYLLIYMVFLCIYLCNQTNKNSRALPLKKNGPIFFLFSFS